MLRTEYCGLFSKEYLGRQVSACGWVLSVRDMGGIIFVDLNDKKGVLQVVFDSGNLSKKNFEIAEHLRTQSVLSVNGIMRLRDDETKNEKSPTGEIELYANEFKVLSTAKPLPFSLEEKNTKDEIRLKYRYLDLRKNKMQNNLQFRHKVQMATQNYLNAENFVYVETPMLTKSTPEGARDYVVPSRVHQGNFYALPQSPQIFKQLLMVGGVDKYYQVARCFRDEDLRADRQPEFTQVDMEMSFVDQEDVLLHVENLFKYIFKECMGYEIKNKFPRLTWKQAMDIYGTDKPDLRFALPIIDLSNKLKNCDFKVFKNVLNSGGTVRAINIPGGAKMSRSDIEKLTDKAISYGAKGMAWIAIRENGEIYSILSKYFSGNDINTIVESTNAHNGDFILFCADKVDVARKTLGNLRKDIAEMFGMCKSGDFKFAIITDFPQFEYSQDEKRYVAMHHPFTMPYEEDLGKMQIKPEEVRAQAYDFVLNGVELGSGSIRIHSPEVQEQMFEALGFSKEEVESRFGFMVNAFSYGTPPHGGFAFGLDRLVMLLLDENSLREVIAFPKTKDAGCLLTQAPSPIDKEQLDILGLNNFAKEHAAQNIASNKENIPGIDIEKLAALSQLEFTDKEKQDIKVELEEMACFANGISKVDTTGYKPMVNGIELVNVMREDVVQNTSMQKELLSTAAKSDGEYIQILCKSF